MSGVSGQPHLETLLDPIKRVTSAQARRYADNDLRFWQPEQNHAIFSEMVKGWLSDQGLNDLLTAIFQVPSSAVRISFESVWCRRGQQTTLQRSE